MNREIIYSIYFRVGQFVCGYQKWEMRSIKERRDPQNLKIDYMDIIQIIYDSNEGGYSRWLENNM